MILLSEPRQTSVNLMAFPSPSPHTALLFHNDIRSEPTFAGRDEGPLRRRFGGNFCGWIYQVNRGKKVDILYLVAHPT